MAVGTYRMLMGSMRVESAMACAPCAHSEQEHVQQVYGLWALWARGREKRDTVYSSKTQDGRYLFYSLTEKCTRAAAYKYNITSYINTAFVWYFTTTLAPYLLYLLLFRTKVCRCML